MAIEPRRQRHPVKAAFWDTSAIVPLCCFQPQSARARRTARQYPRQVTWWVTAVEAVSAFNRLWREQALNAAGRQQALARLDYLRRRWNEVQPIEDARSGAERLLGVHRLRAADALQLSAAMVWCGGRPSSDRCFIAADGDLAAAAETEGFSVIRVV